MKTTIKLGHAVRFALATALLLSACKSGGDDAPQEAEVESVSAALTTPPGGYLNLQVFNPKAGYVATDLFGINNAGTVVGYSSAAYGPYPGGQAAEPFVADRGAAPVQLSFPWPNGGETYATSINSLGWLGGFGGPQNTTYNLVYSNTVLYHPDRSWERPTIPTPAVAKLWPTDSYGPTTGLPDLIGIAQVYDVGTLAAWHLDNDAVDVIGHSSMSPPSSGFVNPGKYGQAAKFDGTACVSATATADTQVGGSTGLTMMAWVRPDAAMCGTGGTRVVVQRGTDYTLALTCTTPGHAALTHTFSGLETGYTTPVGDVLLDGITWTHVAVSWDRSKVRSYVNGVVVATANLVGTAIGWTGTSISLGCAPGTPATNYRGALDEVALFRHPMGTDQITRYMNNGGDYRPVSPMVQGAHWQWGRYIDGFFDAIAPPIGAQYTAWTYGIGWSQSGRLYGTQGLTNSDTVGVVYTGATGMVDANKKLPTSSGWAVQTVNGINASGTAVGAGLYNTAHALYKMDVTGTTWPITYLGPYPRAPYNASNYYLQAAGINAAGHIIGNVYDGTNTVSQRALLWTKELGLVDLNDWVDPASGWSIAHVTAINDSDEIIGFAYNAQSVRLAFRTKLTFLGANCLGKADGTSCSDGDPCTSGDICQAQVCVSNARCVSSDPCQRGTCDVTAGKCVFAPSPSGTSCSDGKACTADERCDGAGACLSGPAQLAMCAPPDATHLPGVCDDLHVPTPPTSGLEGWWSFEGDGADKGGGGHTLLASSGVTFANGKAGKAASLDGVSACMSSAAWSTASMSGATGVSLMAWVKLPAGFMCPPPVNGVDQTMVVASKGNDYAIGLTCIGPNPLAAALRLPVNGTPGPQWLAGMAVTPGTWHLIAATWDATGQTVYTDGMPMSKFTTPVSAVTNGDARFAVGCPVGGHPTSASAFPGLVDEVSLYRRTLTASEISLYYGDGTKLACTYPAIAPETVACNGKADGTACSPGLCAANNVCFQGVCGGAGTTSSGQQAKACLSVTGVVDLGAGASLALIGYTSTTGTNARPYAWIEQPGQINQINAPPPFGAVTDDPGIYQVILNEQQVLNLSLGGQSLTVSGAWLPKLTPLASTMNPLGTSQLDHVVVGARSVQLRGDVVGCVGANPGDLCGGGGSIMCSFDHRCGYAVVIDRTMWGATALKTSVSSPANAIDKNASTNWITDGPTAFYDWFQVDMNMRQGFNRILIDAGKVTNNYVVAYDVMGYDNLGDTLGHLITSGQTSSPYLDIKLPSTAQAQMIRVVNRTSGALWTIHELRVSNDW